MGYHHKSKYSKSENIFKSSKGFTLLETALFLSILALMFTSFMKIYSQLKEKEYKQLQNFHKEWKRLEDNYGKNQSQFKIKDIGPMSTQ